MSLLQTALYGLNDIVILTAANKTFSCFFFLSQNIKCNIKVNYLTNEKTLTLYPFSCSNSSSNCLIFFFNPAKILHYVLAMSNTKISMHKCKQNMPLPQGLKTFFMLNSAEHGSFSANKYANANIEQQLTFSYLLAEKFSRSAMFGKKEFVINSNLRFISRTISCSSELSMKKVLWPPTQI